MAAALGNTPICADAGPRSSVNRSFAASNAASIAATPDGGATQFALSNGTATTTALTSGNITLPWSPNAQSLTMTASITASGVTVNQGAVTFDTYVPKAVSGVTTYVVVPVTILVAAGMATNTYFLPAGLPVGTYSLPASYVDAADIFLPSSDTSHTLTVTAPSLVVNTATDDSGSASDAGCLASPETTCTLCDALAAAASAGTVNITFSPSVFTAATTIPVASSLTIPSNTTVQGPTSGAGATLQNLVTVAGGGPSTGYSVFTMTAAKNAVLANLNITKGNGPEGGGISVGDASQLTVNHCNVTGNISPEGGGIYNLSTLTSENSTVSGNIATGSGGGGLGGGIYSDAAATQLTVIDSTISGNRATGNVLAWVGRHSLSIAKPFAATATVTVGFEDKGARESPSAKRPLTQARCSREKPLLTQLHRSIRSGESIEASMRLSDF